MKRRYRRYFVILEGEDTGFEVSRSQQPKGHAKVEISNEKGAMVLQCQNLREIHDSRMRYRWYLVNTNKEDPTIVDIGPMEVDSSGKGEVNWEFNSENVKGTKETIEDFNVLILLAESFDQKKILTAPLVGYIDKEKSNWRKQVERKLYGTTSSATIQEEKATTIKDVKQIKEEKEIKEVLEEKEVKEVKEVIEVDEAKASSFNESSRKEYSFEESNDTVVENPPFKESNRIEETPRVEEPTEQNVIKHAPSPPPRAPHQTIEPQESYLLNEGNMMKAMQAYIESTLKMFPKVNPFEEALEGYQWWHIYYNYQTIYRSHMPFVAYIDGLKYPSPSQYYPHQYPSEYHRQIYPYQHYLFGIQYDPEKNVISYVYGIPGRNNRSEQPYAGKTGFNQWIPSKKGKTDTDSYGYWLLHIDPRTGQVK